MDAATAAQRVVDIRERTSVDQLKNDLIVRAAIERHLITIGEALQRARALLPDAEIGVSHIDAIIGLRNRLVHGYFAIEWTRIVAILDADLDRLFSKSCRPRSRHVTPATRTILRRRPESSEARALAVRCRGRPREGLVFNSSRPTPPS